MTKNEKTVEDFIKHAPKWIKIHQLDHNTEGIIRVDSMIDLLAAVKELKEKAWKYDDLSK